MDTSMVPSETPSLQAAAPEAAAPETTPGTDAVGSAAIVIAPPARRRRRFAVLYLLLGLFVVFGSFAGWYLITRKPITALPLPAITQQPMPKYLFSVYGPTKPTGIAVTSDGSRIYVTDPGGSGGLMIFDGQGRKVADVSVPDSFPGDHVMVYVATDPATGDIYVSDRPAGAIWIFSGDGAFRREFEPDQQLNGWQPLGIAFGPDGNLYVTDLSGPYHRVEVVTKDGKLVRTIGERGQMNFPNGVAVDATGRVFVTDSNDGRLLVFGQDGRRVGLIARGQKQGELGLPRGIAIDDQGLVYVVDMTAHQVQVYAQMATDESTPRFLGHVGKEGSDDGDFLFPNGVAVDARARIYVTDQVNDRVQVWSY
jgi:DNA-binding beta-propeller fold protein YncE